MKNQHIIPAVFAAFAICGGAFAATGDATVTKWAGDAKGAFMLMFDDGWPYITQTAARESNSI